MRSHLRTLTVRSDMTNNKGDCNHMTRFKRIMSLVLVLCVSMVFMPAANMEDYVEPEVEIVA